MGFIQPLFLQSFLDTSQLQYGSKRILNYHTFCFELCQNSYACKSLSEKVSKLYAHSSFVLLERNFREKTKCFQPLRLVFFVETTKAKNISYAFAFQISFVGFSLLTQWSLWIYWLFDSSYSSFLGSFFSSSVSCFVQTLLFDHISLFSFDSCSVVIKVSPKFFLSIII